MFTALLLFMNSLCQMLDTSCASGVLLKKRLHLHDKSYERREVGLLGLEQKGGKREIGNLSRCIGITYFFPVRRSETLLDMVNTDTEKLAEETGLDWIWIPCVGHLHPENSETLGCCGGLKKKIYNWQRGMDDFGQNPFYNFWTSDVKEWHSKMILPCFAVQLLKLDLFFIFSCIWLETCWSSKKKFF